MELNTNLVLQKTKRTDPLVVKDMSVHYSQPRGFVGRNIVYKILYNGVYYGSIVGGSATLHLPGRNNFFGCTKDNLNSICNNIFFHVEKIDGRYPIRNFLMQILNKFENQIRIDWLDKYGDKLIGIETLVELPRSGLTYIRSGYTVVGQTVGFTCKRTAGKGTDDWSGKRVWDTKNLRPKLVLCKKL